MKQALQATIRQILADRPLMLLAMAITLGGIAYIGYVGISLSPSDLQLAVRYTSFGETHFYRDKWWYLLSFIGFGILYIIAHVGITVKLFAVGYKQIAYAFGWLSLIVLVLMFVYTYSVLGIAYLN